MIRRLARLLWRVMPRWLREPMAIEAPVVLGHYEFEHRGGVHRSWVRMEIDLGVDVHTWDDAGEHPRSFTYDRKFHDGLGLARPEFATDAEAFEALTAILRADPGFVLTDDKMVHRPPEVRIPAPKLLTGKAV